MKQFSAVLNIVLLFAVAFLYYLHYGSDKKAKQNTAPLILNKDSAKRNIPVIAYVELDSLHNSVGFLKENKKMLEAEQRRIATEYENAYHNLAEERDNFLKKGKAITQQEADAFQEKLAKRQQEIEAVKQAGSQKLAEKSAAIMEDMQGKIKDFLNDYNKEKKYTYILATGTGLDYLFYKDSTLNITCDIIEGLNAKMKAAGK